MEDRIEFSNKVSTITCPESKAFPAPKIRWEADGKKLPTDARYKVDGRSLSIHALKIEDSRNYTCVAENLAGVQRQSMQLQVYGESN